MKKPDVAKDLEVDYLSADFKEGYLGYFEIPQEEAKELAAYIEYLEVELAKIQDLSNKGNITL